MVEEKTRPKEKALCGAQKNGGLEITRNQLLGSPREEQTPTQILKKGTFFSIKKKNPRWGGGRTDYCKKAERLQRRERERREGTETRERGKKKGLSKLRT